MLHEQPVAADEAVPLFVDVDGTLTRADISLESFVRIARSGVLAVIALLGWLVSGRAIAKTMAARRDPVDPAQLPYRQEVLDLIEQARQDGRSVILASASHRRNILRIARHLGLPGPVIATRGRTNLKSEVKLAAIRQRIGPEAPFDYIGDSKADQCLWREARQSWSVGYLPASGRVKRLGKARPGLMRALAKAARPHQWAKNGLVLVPAFTSGEFTEPTVFLKALGAAVLMSVIASSIYLLNDLLDIDSDRAHRT